MKFYFNIYIPNANHQAIYHIIFIIKIRKKSYKNIISKKDLPFNFELNIYKAFSFCWNETV